MSLVETASAAWAARISEAWRKSIEGVLEAGKLLREAKLALPPGAFTGMIENSLPFGARTAQMLMKIAADQRLNDAKHVSLLPPHWGTLYELTKLSDEAFEARLATGRIHPEMERRDVVVAAVRERRAEREAELGAFQAALPQKRYGVIYADPPWRYEHPPMGGSNRSIENHYPTMTLDEICALDVASLAADDAILFLWATAPKLIECAKVVEAWGFNYRTNLVWIKDKIGMGYWFRNKHELLLVGTRGEPPAPAPGTQLSSVRSAPVHEHSRKPEVFYELIRVYFPNLPKIELFLRGKAREGWDAWGNEAREAAE